MSVLVPIALVSAIIAIHEAAHALTSYAFGIKPESIHIGLPFKPKKEFITKGGMPVTISFWLIGGGIVLDNDKLESLSFIKKTAIFVAGPMMNLFAGIVTASAFYGIGIGTRLAREIVSASTESVKQLTTGDVPAKDIVGPVGVVDYGAELVQTDPIIGPMLFWLVINFMMGIFNLIPIPGLDGGRIVMGAVTSLSGNSKRVINITRAITTVFLLVLILGMITVTIKDLYNLFR